MRQAPPTGSDVIYECLYQFRATYFMVKFANLTCFLYASVEGGVKWDG